jgi:putative flippase GtrA
LSQSLADRIRGMAQYLDDPHVIAKTLGLEESIVEGVLSGEIPDESLENYNIAKPAEIKIVEQKRFIRSRAIGVIATNNYEGSLLTAYMAANLADQVSYDIAIADFNEFPVQSTLLDVNNANHAMSINFLLNEEDDFKDKGQSHPTIKNLSLFLGTTNIAQNQVLTDEKVISLLSDISANYGVVFIDCPNTSRWKAVLPFLDFIIIVVDQSHAGLSRYTHIYNYIDSLKITDRVSVVLVNDGQTNNIPSTDARKYIHLTSNIPVIGVLPYDTAARKPENLLKPSKYQAAVNNALRKVFTDLPAEKKKGFLQAILTG